MLSCAREIHVLCLRGILVAYHGVRALCCLEVVVVGCWLCHFGVMGSQVLGYVKSL